MVMRTGMKTAMSAWMFFERVLMIAIAVVGLLCGLAVFVDSQVQRNVCHSMFYNSSLPTSIFDPSFVSDCRRANDAPINISASLDERD